MTFFRSSDEARHNRDLDLLIEVFANPLFSQIHVHFSMSIPFIGDNELPCILECAYHSQRSEISRDHEGR